MCHSLLNIKKVVRKIFAVTLEYKLEERDAVFRQVVRDSRFNIPASL